MCTFRQGCARWELLSGLLMHSLCSYIAVVRCVAGFQVCQVCCMSIHTSPTPLPSIPELLGWLQERAHRQAKIAAVSEAFNAEDQVWDDFVIRGTCRNLEKSFFRLTAVPDPADVRPEPVLQEALARLVRLLAEGSVRYLYAVDQFKVCPGTCWHSRCTSEPALWCCTQLPVQGSATSYKTYAPLAHLRRGCCRPPGIQQCRIHQLVSLWQQQGMQVAHDPAV